ncbi:kinase-like domain-containing protein [Thelephora terrestris]|uniref:Kinase-like domain-containing protein n=1 Tax=Thelephora terrestris TaxID=56493 RepID=A0A9P6HAK9_9AGAM|nr:kinase-like domain-containing protein [Thelephora terrestris]
MVASSADSGEHHLMFPTVDVMGKVSSSLTTDAGLRWKCSLTLDDVCNAHDIPPTSYPRVNSLAVSGDGPAGYGGSADIWRGEVGGCPVAVKVIRRYSTVPIARAREQFYQEVLVWERLTHPNILPFLGIDTEIFPLAMISVWMRHGNLREYLVCFPSASRLNLILDASKGLEYMHALGYVHGDLKSSNVLIDDNHSARLADFGSSAILPSSKPDVSAFSNAFAVRWLAPELILPEEFGFSARVCSKQSDVYALAMLMYEAFSGLFPFEGYRDEGVILQVISGARPDRPHVGPERGLTDGVWAMMQECWDSGDRRWTISSIVSHLEWSIASTGEMVGLDEHESGCAGASEPGVARQRFRNKLLRGLKQLFCPSPIVTMKGGRSQKGRFS